MELELSSQRNCLACLFKALDVKTGQNNLWTGLKATLCPQKTFFKDNKKADTMTPGLKIKNIIQINIPILCYLHLQKGLPSIGVMVPLPFFINTHCFTLLMRVLFGLLPESVLPEKLFFLILNKCLLPVSLAFYFQVDIVNAAIQYI